MANKNKLKTNSKNKRISEVFFQANIYFSKLWLNTGMYKINLNFQMKVNINSIANQLVNE